MASNLSLSLLSIVAEEALLLSLPPENTLIAGVDEVGRGALFGPVVAAAVVFPPAAAVQLRQLGVKDSKQLTPKRRAALVPLIHNLAIAYQVRYASVREIDRLNILQASLLAMKRAVVRLSVQPGFCLIDGPQPIPGLALPQQPTVKGDQNLHAIAAASILAKVWRDELMVRLSRKYPDYDLAANKGYGSPRHRLALQQLGPSPYHRLSFRPCQSPGIEKPARQVKQENFPLPIGSFPAEVVPTPQWPTDGNL
ncbi:MAG: ribonuclease HII [Chloroflexaceae bacterium]|nr:ribonuclease HII [Chloroflexaceae bacterium]